MSDRAAEVLVVGAGPTGLTMACELFRHGVPCRIVDQAEAPSVHSKALAVHSRTLEVFEDMGIASEAISRGHKVRASNLYADGRRLFGISFDHLDAPYPFILILAQSETEGLLGRHLISLGGKVEWNISVAGVQQDEGGVTATLLHPDGCEETVHTSWLVGCDGAHSTVRKALGLPFEGRPYEQRAILADVCFAGSLPCEEVSTFLSEEGALTVIPFSAEMCRVYTEAPIEKRGQSQAEPALEEIQGLVDARGPGNIILSQPEWITIFRLDLGGRLVPCLREGRCFLAGDAAHVHSPVGGQGMNVGIQDAYNLAWKLALVIHGAGHPALLDSYQSERHPIAKATVKGVGAATRFLLSRNAVVRGLFKRIFMFLGRRKIVKQRLPRVAAGFAINYRKSAIVAECPAPLSRILLARRQAVPLPNKPEWRSFKAAPAAGDRAPDVVLGGQGTDKLARLFELLRGTRHTLLLFAGEAPVPQGFRNLAMIGTRVREQYGKYITTHVVVLGDRTPEELYGNSFVLLDNQGLLHHRYGAGSECLYLIRPDGYIGYRSQPADAGKFLSYLAQVFVSLEA